MLDVTPYNEKFKHSNNFYNTWKIAYLMEMLDTITNKDDSK